MYDNFTKLVIILAAISVVSWAVVGFSVLVRWAARLRYQGRKYKHAGQVEEVEAEEGQS